MDGTVIPQGTFLKMHIFTIINDKWGQPHQKYMRHDSDLKNILLQNSQGMVLGVWLLLPLAEHALWSYSGAFDPRPCRLATIVIVTWPGEASRCSCRGKMLKHFADLTVGAISLLWD
jgi:hypothetical protein